MARQETAGTIINRAAVEVGLSEVADPFSSQDSGMNQMVGLLNVAGLELLQQHPWQEILSVISIDTDTDIVNGNEYPLPADYDRIVDDTGWDTTENLPLIPLNTQQWNYLTGRNLVQNSVYTGYRVYQDNLQFFPTNVPTGHTMTIQYVVRNWATSSAGAEIDRCTESSDVVKFDPLLMQKFLKVKYLIANSLPADDAKNEFNTVFQNRKGTDNPGQRISLGSSPAFPYIDIWRNVSDTGYGL